MGKLRMPYRLILWASWCYLALVVLLWLAIIIGGDRWWLATVILFSPRWIFSLPLVMLLPLAAWRNRKSLFPLLISALILFGPFMGMNLPWRKGDASGRTVLRILTCNLNAGNFSTPALLSLILDTQADIVALQECPRQLNLGLPSEWHTAQDGELAVLSRYPLATAKAVHILHRPHKWPRTSLLQCVVQAPGGDVMFTTVHLPSPRYGLQTILDRTTLINLPRRRLLIDETAYRRQASQAAERAIAASLPMPAIVAGDFNMPVDSTIYRTVWKGYTNAFSETGLGYGWTELAAIRGVKIGVRIDHVLTGVELVPLVCQTGPDIGSDHLPLIADIAKK